MSITKLAKSMPRKEMKSLAEQLKEKGFKHSEQIKEEKIINKLKNLSPTTKAAVGIGGAGLLTAVTLAAKHHKGKKK